MKQSYCRKNLKQYEKLEGWEQISLGEWFHSICKKYKNRVAVVDSQKEYTYLVLEEKVNHVSSGLYHLGIHKGDHVVIQLPNHVNFVISLFAVIRIGAIPILALPAHRESEIEGIMKVASPKAYIVAERYLGYQYLPMVEQIKKKFDCLETIIVDKGAGGDYQLDSLKGTAFESQSVECYQTAVLLLSGGTTGVPKLIPRTHTDYLYNARMSAKRCEINQDTVYLAALPVAHNFPLCCPGLVGTFDVGGKVILSKTTSPDEILSLISEEHVTMTALVPALVNMCLEMLEWDESFDLSSLKLLQVGGAVLEDTLADKIIDRLPCKLMQVFGTAEGLLCFTKLDDLNEIVARCQGTPISPADEVRIVNEQGQDVEQGQFGELLSRGPYTIDGYYNADEVNASSFTQDGFYKTGDRAMWTLEGNIRLGGRLKEQINRAGEKITPAEVEYYLCQHEDIKDVVVVGVPDDTLGQRICAFLKMEAGKKLLRKDIFHFLQEKGLAEYKIPDQIECLELWPLTSVGKMDKKELVRFAQSRE